MRKGNTKRREMSRSRRLHIKLYMGMFTSYVLENQKGSCGRKNSWGTKSWVNCSYSFLELCGDKTNLCFTEGLAGQVILIWHTLTKDMQNYQQYQIFQCQWCLPPRFGFPPLPHALTVNYRSHCRESQPL